MTIFESADDEARIAAASMDWGVVVEEHQGGIDVFTVGLPRDHAVSLLEKAIEQLKAGS